VAGRTFDSLRVPGFRWYLAAQFATASATGMEFVVIGLVAWEVTESFAALSLVALLRSEARFAWPLVGGVLADRFPRKYLVQLALCGSGCASLVVALLVARDELRFSHVVISVLVQGSLISMATPARMAMLPGVVGIGRIQNAQALELGAANLAWLVGPATVGLLLWNLSESATYLVVAVLPFVAALLYMRVPRADRGERGSADGSPSMRRRSAVHDLLDGIRYALQQRTIRMLLGVSLVLASISAPSGLLLADYFDEVIDARSDWVAAWTIVGTAGAAVMCLVIASLPPRRRGKLLIVTSILGGIVLLGIAYSPPVIVALPLLVTVGATRSMLTVLSGALVQTHVHDAYRGRVSGLLVLAMGMSSAPWLVGTWLSVTLGPFWPALVIAIMLLGAVSIWLFVPQMRELD